MKKENRHTGIKILFSFLIITICFYLYGRFINPYSLNVKEVAIKDNKLNSDYNGLKIVQFSDLHYGRTTNEDTLKKLVKEINELKPDIVIFTGDLFDSKNINNKDEDKIIKYFSQIESQVFKFACLGDYDLKNENRVKGILENSNFIVLDNTSKLVYYESKTPLNFIGITNDEKINELFDNEYFNITIMHQPDLVDKLDNTSIAFAGHSLGGQFRIPFIGGIRKKDGAKTYIESYHKVKNTKLYISNGLGTEDISLRFFNSPSITLYRLYSN
jgi:hypothetical protein